MGWKVRVGWLSIAMFVGGCASLACRPLTIDVAKKEERPRVDTIYSGARTTGGGALEEVRTPVVVRDYWLQAKDGTWYRVPEDRFRAAEAGRPLEICQ